MPIADTKDIAAAPVILQGTDFNVLLSVYAAGTVYSLTTAYATLDFGTTDPTLVLTKAGTWLLFSQVQLERNGMTITNQTAGLKLRRTNNTAADVTGAAIPTIDLPVSTTLTDTLGVFNLPPVQYQTANTDDAIAIQGIISGALGAGSLDASKASIVALYLGPN